MGLPASAEFARQEFSEYREICKIRDGAPSIFTLFAIFAEFARPECGEMREFSKMRDGLSSILTRFTKFARGP